MYNLQKMCAESMLYAEKFYAKNWMSSQLLMLMRWAARTRANTIRAMTYQMKLAYSAGIHRIVRNKLFFLLENSVHLGKNKYIAIKDRYTIYNKLYVMQSRRACLFGRIEKTCWFNLYTYMGHSRPNRRGPEFLFFSSFSSKYVMDGHKKITCTNFQIFSLAAMVEIVMALRAVINSLIKTKKKKLKLIWSCP